MAQASFKLASGQQIPSIGLGTVSGYLNHRVEGFEADRFSSLSDLLSFLSRSIMLYLFPLQYYSLLFSPLWSISLNSGNLRELVDPDCLMEISS